MLLTVWRTRCGSAGFSTRAITRTRRGKNSFRTRILLATLVCLPLSLYIECKRVLTRFKKEHCIWSLLESVLCHGDTSIRTFHWDPHRPAPMADSAAERRCVDRDWLYRWTGERSFKLEERLLGHPVFGQLDEGLQPVNKSF